MTDQLEIPPQTLTNFPRDTAQFERALKELPNSRHYAADEETLRAGAALLRSVLSARNKPNIPGDEFRDLLIRISEHASEMTQSWRPGPEKPLPRMWKDPATGVPLGNPWDKTAPDMQGQTVLRQRDPELATYLQRLAENPYGLVADINDDKARREELRVIRYTASEHARNPFRFLNLSAQGRFQQTHGKLVADVWRFEAQPMRLPWSSTGGNLTNQGKLFTALNKSPLHAITGQTILNAVAIDKTLLELLRAEAAEAAVAAAKRQQKLAA